MAKQVIPEVRSADPYQYLFDKAMKSNIDAILGRSANSTTINPLATTATLTDVITAVNLIIGRVSP